MMMMVKKLRVDDGVAMVEFAMIAIVFFLMFGGLVDLGDAYVRNTAAVDTVRAGSIVAFDAGESTDHDLRVVKVIVEEARTRRIDNIELIVFFDADRYKEVPPACLEYEAALKHGVAGVCTVYGRGFFERLKEGKATKLFADDCDSSVDKLWCSTDRQKGNGWTVGIYLQAREDALTGVLPFFRSYSITHTASVREFNRLS